MNYSLCFAALFLMSSALVVRAEPTFADLAVLLAKGQFKEHVSQDASLEECAAFLNRRGICFPLFDLMDREKRVAKEDFARALGQSRLRFLGEAELENGCIKRPDKLKSWVDYCMLNDVDLDRFWNGFRKRVEKSSLPEVERFFKKTL